MTKIVIEWGGNAKTVYEVQYSIARAIELLLNNHGIKACNYPEKEKGAKDGQ